MMYHRENTKAKKAQALVIAIFIMMALSLIAWTVVNFSAADLSVGARLVDSERALYVAEGGVSWAANQASNSSWCGNVSPATTYKLGNGEYAISCSSANGTVVTSTGYVPSKSGCDNGSCLGKRVIQQTLSSGSLNRLVQAYNYFDWSGVTSNSTYRSELNGEIRVGGSSNPNTPPEFYLGNYGGTEFGCAQSFYVPAGSGSLKRIRFYHDAKNNKPAGQAIFKIVKDSGGWPSANVNDIVANSTFNYLPGQNRWRNHRYTTPLTLNSGWYWMVWDLQNTAQNQDNYFQLHSGDDSKLPPDFTKPNPYPGVARVFYYNNGIVWQDLPAASDVMYNMYFDSGSLITSDSLYGYEGDGATPPVHNKFTNASLVNYNPNGDYGPYQPLYTPSLNPAPARGFMNYADFPTINMDCLKKNASITWPDPIDRQLQIPWAMVPVGTYSYDGGSTYHTYSYAQSFTVPTGGANKQRRVAQVYVLHGPTVLAAGNPQIRLQIYNSDGPGGLPNTVAKGTNGNPIYIDYMPSASGWKTVDFSGLINATRQLPDTGSHIYWLVWDVTNFSDSYTMLRLSHDARSNIAVNFDGSWKKPYDTTAPDVAPDIACYIVLDAGAGYDIYGDSSYLYAASPGFFANMQNQAIRNYSKTGDWDNSIGPAAPTDPAQRLEWGVIDNNAYMVKSLDSPPPGVVWPGVGTDTLAVLVGGQQVIYHNDAGLSWDNKNQETNDTHADDWYDTDGVELIKRFTPADNNLITDPAQNWYLAGGMVIDATSDNVNLYKKSFVAENDIGLVGWDKAINLQANITQPKPLLASNNGDIYSTTPSNGSNSAATAQRRNLQGMVYTQNGTVTFDYLWAANGAAISGYNVYLSDYVTANYNAAVVCNDCFSSSSASGSWQEQ
jgi:hypothetical protein